MLFFVISDTKASYSSFHEVGWRAYFSRPAFFFFGYFGNDDRQRKLMKVKVTHLSTGCKA
jgi:hypothetical protein